MDQRGHFHIGGTAQWNVPKTQRRGEVTPQHMKPYLAIDLALGRPNSLWPPNCLCLKFLSLEFI